MTARAGDCEHCHAIAPALGEIEHAWDCERPPYGRFLSPPPDAGWIDDGMSAEESRAAAIALARRIEAAWATRAERRRAAQLARCDREIAAMREQTGAPAYLVTLGIADWERERELIQARDRKSTTASAG